MLGVLAHGLVAGLAGVLLVDEHGHPREGVAHLTSSTTPWCSRFAISWLEIAGWPGLPAAELPGRALAGVKVDDVDTYHPFHARRPTARSGRSSAA